MGGTVRGALKPWDDIAPDPLAFPIAGKTYVVPAIGYRAGLRIEQILSDDPSAAEGITNEDLWRLGLGDIYDAMVKDDVPPLAIARAGMAALTDYRHGRAAAELVWEAGLDPEALAAAATAAKTSQTRTPSPDTATANTTPSPASTSGTRTSQPS